jgi:hypothetical protein
MTIASWPTRDSCFGHARRAPRPQGALEEHLDLGAAAGRANVGDKLLTLVMSALAGGDCIDDAVRHEAPYDRVGGRSPPPTCRSRPVKLGAA